MSDGRWYEYDKDIICPYCCKTYTPEYEMLIGDDGIDIYVDGKEQECTCEKCGKKFIVTPKIEWYYRTRTIAGEEYKARGLG